MPSPSLRSLKPTSHCTIIQGFVKLSLVESCQKVRLNTTMSTRGRFLVEQLADQTKTSTPHMKQMSKGVLLYKRVMVFRKQKKECYETYFYYHILVDNGGSIKGYLHSIHHPQTEDVGCHKFLS